MCLINISKSFSVQPESFSFIKSKGCSMKYTLPLILCLFLGIFCNVICAWSFTLMGPIAPGTKHEVKEVSAWLADVPPDWPSELNVCGQASGIGVTVKMVGVATPKGTDYFQTIFSYGWPFRSMDLECRMVGDPNGVTPKNSVVDAYQVSPHTPPGRIHPYLPLRPIWGGFVGNSLIFGFLCWFWVCGIPILQRIDRRSRGVCSHCAYPTGSGPVCTECGHLHRATSKNSGGVE